MLRDFYRTVARVAALKIPERRIPGRRRRVDGLADGEARRRAARSHRWRRSRRRATPPTRISSTIPRRGASWACRRRRSTSRSTKRSAGFGPTGTHETSWYWRSCCRGRPRRSPSRRGSGCSSARGSFGGARVKSVVPGSPGERAGIHAGDEVLAIDDSATATPEEVILTVQHGGVGHAAKLRLVDGKGHTRVVGVTFEARPDRETLQRSAADRAGGARLPAGGAVGRQAGQAVEPARQGRGDRLLRHLVRAVRRVDAAHRGAPPAARQAGAGGVRRVERSRARS